MQDLGTDAKSRLYELNQSLTFIHSPFCGTCHVAQKMLDTIEAVYQKTIFNECNASLNPDLMKEYKVKSVPCLLITSNGEVEEKIYAFESVPHMYDRVSKFVR